MKIFAFYLTIVLVVNKSYSQLDNSSDSSSSSSSSSEESSSIEKFNATEESNEILNHAFYNSLKDENSNGKDSPFKSASNPKFESHIAILKALLSNSTSEPVFNSTEESESKNSTVSIFSEEFNVTNSVNSTEFSTETTTNRDMNSTSTSLNSSSRPRPTRPNHHWHHNHFNFHSNRSHPFFDWTWPNFPNFNWTRPNFNLTRPNFNWTRPSFNWTQPIFPNRSDINDLFKDLKLQMDRILENMSNWRL